jgi:hypothetical protein
VTVPIEGMDCPAGCARAAVLKRANAAASAIVVRFMLGPFSSYIRLDSHNLTIRDHVPSIQCERVMSLPIARAESGRGRCNGSDPDFRIRMTFARRIRAMAGNRITFCSITFCSLEAGVRERRAAVYNVPLADAVFTLEALSRSLRPAAARRATPRSHEVPRSHLSSHRSTTPSKLLSQTARRGSACGTSNPKLLARCTNSTGKPIQHRLMKIEAAARGFGNGGLMPPNKNPERDGGPSCSGSSSCPCDRTSAAAQCVLIQARASR